MIVNHETTRETLERVFDAAERKMEEDNRFYAELKGESDRGAAILAAEYFKERLGKAIEQRLSALDDRLRKRFKQKDIGFSTRIDLAYMLGLYDRETWERLNDIIRIRNKFAHPLFSNPPDFNTQWVMDKCNKLPVKSEPDPENSRDRYVHYLSEVGDLVWSSLKELHKRTSQE